MDKHNRLMEGLLNVYVIYSIYEHNTLHLIIKTNNHHIRSSSDLFRGDNPGIVIHPELQYSHLVKMDDCVCKMMCQVAASQPRTNHVHIDMVPSVWMMIMGHLKEKTKNMSLSIYHDHDSKVRTVKMGVFVTPDKRIKFATIERETEEHHKLDRIFAYTREHVGILQGNFGIFFGIGARVRHPKPKSEQERQNKKRTLVITPIYAISRGAAVHRIDVCIPASTAATVTTLLSKAATASVMRDIRINTLTQLPSEATIKSKSVIDKFVSRDLADVTFLYDWASNRLTIRVGYTTPMFLDVDVLFWGRNA
jgi:hypothetical protein